MKWEKRFFDIVLSSIGIVLCIPIFIIIAVAIKIEDGGPVFFRQTRIGYRGKPFTILKFRTMVPGAENQGPAITVGADPRITRVGSWLRKIKLDELPQLINVLRGQMSLVGPRPEVPEYVRLYSPDQRRVLDLVPGITDPASLKYRNESELLAQASNPTEEYVNRIMPDKIRINLEYAARATVWSDLRIVVTTVLSSLFIRRPRAEQSREG